MLHRAGQLADDAFASSVGRDGITARQFVVLAIVARVENPSQTLICEETGIDRSTLADIVRRMVARGLLTRRRTKQDARMYAVKITEQGRQALEHATPYARAVDQTLLGVLTSGQRADFENALKLMVERLQKIEA
ncbi:MAG: MarR family winged helix-turn-helix transcriptional regulator [Hyphomicrobium sp.]